MCVGDVIVTRVLARGEHAAQRMTFVNGPRHDEHICTWQWTVATAAGRTCRRRQSFGPCDICESRQAGRRAESQELPPRRSLRIKVNDFALEVLCGFRFGRWRKCKCRGWWRRRNRIEAKISFNPFAIDLHDTSSRSFPQ